MMDTIDLTDTPISLNVPVYSQRVAAGFPSPAADYAEGKLDFNKLLVHRPAATFAVRITGSSMVGAGIVDGCLVVVDRSIKAISGRVIVALLDGSLVVKRLRVGRSGDISLESEPAPGQEDHYPPLLVREHMQFEVWGCVTSAITFLE